MIIIEELIFHCLKCIYMAMFSTGSYRFVSSSKSFLFSLYNINGYAPVKLNIRTSRYSYAIASGSSYGPFFVLRKLLPSLRRVTSKDLPHHLPRRPTKAVRTSLMKIFSCQKTPLPRKLFGIQTLKCISTGKVKSCTQEHVEHNNSPSAVGSS